MAFTGQDLLNFKEFVYGLTEGIPPGSFNVRATTYDYQKAVGPEVSNHVDALIWHVRDRYSSVAAHVDQVYAVLAFKAVSRYGWSSELVRNLTILHALVVVYQKHIQVHGHEPVHLDKLVGDYLDHGDIDYDEVY